ncbi:phosphotransferase [Amycolatopsis sp. NPDC051061]|uniref:phosphotransferase n=1 Tax=Amycolatopsis sp. NPDC051061 TaxID=3155042 RepID=UPI00341D8137
MDIGEAGARLVSRFGPEAEGWLDEVPALATRLASRWGLVLGELFTSGASSVVMRCLWPNGTPAVLKLSPDRTLLGRQVEMLRVFASSGRVPAVLSADVEAGAMVLEEVRPGTEAGELPQTSLPPRWGELLAALHAVAPPARWPWDLRGRCDEAFARVGRRLADPAIGARIGQAAWRRAIQRCEALLDTQARLAVLMASAPV